MSGNLAGCPVEGSLQHWRWDQVWCGGSGHRGGLAQRDRASAAGAVERSAALAFDAIGDVDSAEELGLDKRGLSRLRLTYSHGGRTESQSR